MYKNKEIISAVVFLVLGAAAFAAAGTLPRGVLGQPGPGFFPRVVSVCMMAFSLLLIGKKLREKGAETEASLSTARDYGRVLLMSLLSACYLYSMDAAGFLVSTAGFCALCLLLLGERRPGLIAAMTAAIPLTVFVVFKTLLSVPLPEGILYF